CKTLRATLQLHILSCFLGGIMAYQLINNPCAVQPLLHKISLCVEVFLSKIPQIPRKNASLFSCLKCPHPTQN
ncbi:hypothetical protein, partial [Salmonella enterica]